MVEQSLSAGEPEQRDDRAIVYHGSPFRRIWEILLALLVLYTVFAFLCLAHGGAELYEYASEAMLLRGGASSTELRHLMQAVFFEAQMAPLRNVETSQRVITDVTLNRAVLSAFGPEGALEKLEAQDGAPVVAWLPLSGGLAGAEGAGVEAGAEVLIEFSYEQVIHVGDIVRAFVFVGVGV